MSLKSCFLGPLQLLPSPNALDVRVDTNISFIVPPGEVFDSAWVTVNAETWGPAGFEKFHLVTKLSADGGYVSGKMMHPSGITMDIDERIYDNRAGLFRDASQVIIRLPNPLQYDAFYSLAFGPTSPSFFCSKWTFRTQRVSPGKPNHWSVQCDPWKERPLSERDYTTLGAWHLCPNNHRSPSGCGDFAHDARSATCPTALSLNGCPTHQLGQRCIISHAVHSLDEQPHVCFNEPISFDHLSRYNWIPGRGAPPTNSKHRDQWAKWGAYAYIPPERWLHNVEHGGISVLFHPCLDGKSKCLLHDFVVKLPIDEGGPFRWILTPYNRFQASLVVSIVAYGHTLMSRCFNPREVQGFISNHYRQAIEDIFVGGRYWHLWEDPSRPLEFGCSPQETSISFSRRTSPGKESYLVASAILFLLAVTLSKLVWRPLNVTAAQRALL